MTAASVAVAVVALSIGQCIGGPRGCAVTVCSERGVKGRFGVNEERRHSLDENVANLIGIELAVPFGDGQQLIHVAARSKIVRDELLNALYVLQNGSKSHNF